MPDRGPRTADRGPRTAVANRKPQTDQPPRKRTGEDGPPDAGSDQSRACWKNPFLPEPLTLSTSTISAMPRWCASC